MLEHLARGRRRTNRGRSGKSWKVKKDRMSPPPLLIRWRKMNHSHSKPRHFLPRRKSCYRRRQTSLSPDLQQ